MPDSSGSNFFCDLDSIEELSKLYSDNIEKLQNIFSQLNMSVERIQAEKLLEGSYFDEFLNKYESLEEAYYRVLSIMMVLNISLGNINYLVEPLIEARDKLIDYL